MRFIDLKAFREVPAPSAPLVLCLGNFDGVHSGHRQIIKEALKIKASNPDFKCGVWFFEDPLSKPHPTIFSTEQKLECFARLGLDVAVLADFGSVRGLSPNAFIEDILKRDCGCVHALCGENFRFGAGASADAERLCELMEGNATVVPLLKEDGVIVSSTLIASLLSEGEIEHANRLLGDRFYFQGKILHGKALGRTLGFPTTNQALPQSFPLKSGVYATLCRIDQKEYYGITNLGSRPTVDRECEKNLETYLLDFSDDCYGKDMRVEFISRLRDETKFPSLDALRAQIAKDVEALSMLIKQ